MANFSASGPSFGTSFLHYNSRSTQNADCGWSVPKRWAVLAGLVLFSSLAAAQGSPHVAGVDPAMGKVNDTVAVSGSDLGKDAVSSVYLSDDKNDYKAAIVTQTDTKIEVKVPQVKPSEYNISIQVGNKLFITTVKFTVEG
jgi:IPT/TIG domain